MSVGALNSSFEIVLRHPEYCPSYPPGSLCQGLFSRSPRPTGLYLMAAHKKTRGSGEREPRVSRLSHPSLRGRAGGDYAAAMPSWLPPSGTVHDEMSGKARAGG